MVGIIRDFTEECVNEYVGEFAKDVVNSDVFDILYVNDTVNAVANLMLNLILMGIKILISIL